MQMLVKAYGDAAMNRTALHKWYSRYENRYESVMDERTSDVNNVAESSGNQITPG